MTSVIVGAAETNELGRLPNISAIQLSAQASMNALADAGLSIHDIDGLACAGINPIDVSDYLGIRPTWIDGTDAGGCSPVLHMRHAIAAIEAGLCSTVLICHGESGRSGVGMTEWKPQRQSHMEQFEVTFGATSAPVLFAIGLLRYMRETGMTLEQLASVPVVQREWASRNPRAKMRDLITVEDVLSSPLIAYPLHLLMCCLVTDGGGAIVLTSAERARVLGSPKPPVRVLGVAEAFESPLVLGLEDPTRSRAIAESSRAAIAQARIDRSDIDHLMIYDAFAHVPIFGLEAIGFVERGQAAAFIADGNTAPGGSLPMNTNGGGLSYTHTGMYGMYAIQEGIRQIRGEAAAQVPKVDVSLIQAVGGMFMSSGCLILGSSRTE